uniref:Uncharacterized protein n=1 Tax=Oryza punctata TaxID=4537 RepID=A0A0E0M7D3_ORYPU
MNKRRFSAHSLILVTVLAVLIVLAMPTALLGFGVGRRALGDPHGAQSTAAMQQDASSGRRALGGPFQAQSTGASGSTSSCTNNPNR